MTDSRFTADVVEGDGHVVVALAGDFDLAARDRFYEVFDQLRTIQAAVVLDVSGLTFVDTVGLGCLCFARNALFERTGKAPRLAGATLALRQMLVLSGIDDLFEWPETNV
jgi:anti-sigma B factor antagonist